MTTASAASFAPISYRSAVLAGVLGLAFGVAALGSLSLWSLTGLVLTRVVHSERRCTVVTALFSLLLASSIVPIWVG